MKGTIFEHTSLLYEPIRALKHNLATNDDLDVLIDRIGDARFVLLGEASHGTHEYYTWRARITQRLIKEKGFNFIAVEGDWPDCYAVNSFIKGYNGSAATARDALLTFERWPTWMWANWEIVALTIWLRKWNQQQSAEQRVGFYGLDLYSLWESLDAVMKHLQKSHPDKVELALRAFQCFEPFNRDSQEYAWSLRLGLKDCEDELVDMLLKLRETPLQLSEDPESHFNAEQNAIAALGAERYYRTMVRSDDHSWNVRDTHMADTLDRLIDRHGPECKAIIWEHNTHIGDARATDMADAGMVNIGQLVRERHHKEGVVLIGFGSYEGSVIAGDRWGAPMKRMPVPQARSDSWEGILHDADPDNLMLIMDDFKELEGFQVPRGHRAIGVVYHPEREYGNYVPTFLAQRYDAFLFLRQTKALHPLHLEPHNTNEPPETYPWGV